MPLVVSLLNISSQTRNGHVMKASTHGIYVYERREMVMRAVCKQDKHAVLDWVYPEACARKPQMAKAFR